MLQLSPRPQIPFGNNEETLLPSYTPEIGRSVRRLEHNYAWDMQWLQELHAVVIHNAKALSTLQGHIGELDHETGVAGEKINILSSQTAASLNAMGMEVSENDRQLKNVLEWDHHRVQAATQELEAKMVRARRDMAEHQETLATYLENADANYVAMAKRVASLEEHLKDHRILLSASGPRVLAPGAADAESAPPPPAMSGEIDARFEGLTQRIALAEVKNATMGLKLAETEDFMVQVTSAG